MCAAGPVVPARPGARTRSPVGHAPAMSSVDYEPSTGEGPRQRDGCSVALLICAMSGCEPM
eukprot:365702-Chlamydomonas_euryale.AAC.6